MANAVGRCLVELERESRAIKTYKAASFLPFEGTDRTGHSRVLQLLHDEAVNHVRHVSWNFAGCESELAVQQLVDVAQRVGKSVA